MVSTEFRRRFVAFITAACSVLLLCLLFPAFAKTATKDDPSVRLFEIPAYPGTVELDHSRRFDRISPPFATVMTIFRTPDRKPLDREKVVEFYRAYLTKKGWVAGIDMRPNDEGYLSLRVNLHNTFPDRTTVHLAGNFRLWVAPKDGMMTILVDQWRISSPNQETLTYLTRVNASLDGIAKNNGYYVQKVHQDSVWDRDFENEHLIRRERFTFFANETVGPHGRSDQMIDLLILSFSDASNANYEARRRQPSKSDDAKTDKQNIVQLRITSEIPPVILVQDKTVMVITERSGKQTAVVQQIAAELTELFEKENGISKEGKAIIPETYPRAAVQK